jgi:hypothetical protein
LYVKEPPRDEKTVARRPAASRIRR